MRITILICFTAIGVSTFGQPEFQKNRYLASIYPSDLLHELPYIDYWFNIVNRDLYLEANYVKKHKIKSITERKYPIKKRKRNHFKDNYRKLYFNENGYPIKIEDGEDMIIEFEYDDKNNLTSFCAIYNFWMVKHENLITEIIFENQYKNNLLINQVFKCISTNYKFKKKQIGSSTFRFSHNISYISNDSIEVVTICNHDTLFRKAHKNVIYPTNTKEYLNNEISLKDKDTLLFYALSESKIWSIRKISEKKYDDFGYLVKMNAVVYKENSLENYDTLFYYTRKTLDTITVCCPHLWTRVVTKGTKPEQNPDSIRYYPSYRFDTMNVQYQFDYMDNPNYTCPTKLIYRYILLNENGDTIDQYERYEKYCTNYYSKNGLIEKQVFTNSPFNNEPKDSKWDYSFWNYDYFIKYEYTYY